MKLVRDRIPEIIKESGREPDFYIASETEYIKRLYDKLREELDEFIADPSYEEAGDMYEVFIAILDHHNMKLEHVDGAAFSKWNDRGGFKKRIILREAHDTDDEEWKNYCAWGH